MHTDHVSDDGMTRRRFGRAVSAAGLLAVGSTALLADDQPAPPPVRRGPPDDHHGHDDHGHDEHGPGAAGGPGVYFDVQRLPFHLQHEFMHAVSCNNVVARAENVEFGGEDSHAIRQQPGQFGWGTLTFFLRLDPRLVGQEVVFRSTVGWNGRAQGEVPFSVEINGDVVIDGARSRKDEWMPVERRLPVKAAEMRVTLMVDSIRGDNDFAFWWGEPQLAMGRAGQPGPGQPGPGGQPGGRPHEHEHDDRPQGAGRPPFGPDPGR